MNPNDSTELKRANIQAQFTKDRDDIALLSGKYRTLSEAVSNPMMKETLTYIADHLALAAKAFGGR